VKTAVETIASAPRRMVRPPVPPSAVAKEKSTNSRMRFAIAGGLGFVAVVAASIWWFSKGPPAGKAKAPIFNAAVPTTNIASSPLRTAGLNSGESRDWLADLKSPNATRQRIALSRLASMEVSEPNEEVCRALTNALTAAEWPTRQLAARALANWGGTEALPALRSALADPEFSVRWAAIEAVGRFKDAQAAQPLAQLLCDSSCTMKAHQALVAIGPTAEDAVLKIFAQRDADCRRAACRVLKEIGTQRSLPALTAAAKDADGITVMLAKEAIQTIELRVRIKTSLKPKP
jgi:HEAT repeat protein